MITKEQFEKLCQVAPNHFRDGKDNWDGCAVLPWGRGWRRVDDLTYTWHAVNLESCGEILWWMLTQMQERWHRLCFDDARSESCAEVPTLRSIMESRVWSLSNDLIISTYIAWKSALKAGERA